MKTMCARPELQGKLLARGGWDYELVEALPPQKGDIVISKPRYSAFYNTNLDSVLRARGIRSLVFTGVATTGRQDESRNSEGGWGSRQN